MAIAPDIEALLEGVHAGVDQKSAIPVAVRVGRSRRSTTHRHFLTLTSSTHHARGAATNARVFLVVVLLLLVLPASEKEPQTNADDSDDSESHTNDNTGEGTLAHTASTSPVVVDDFAIGTIAVAVAARVVVAIVCGAGWSDKDCFYGAVRCDGSYSSRGWFTTCFGLTGQVSN